MVGIGVGTEAPVTIVFGSIAVGVWSLNLYTDMNKNIKAGRSPWANTYDIMLT